MFSLALPTATSGATLTSTAVALSDSRHSQTNITYDWRGSSLSNALPIKCIKVTFSANADGSGTIGNSFTAASATVNVGASTILNGASGGSWTSVQAANSFQYHNTGNTGVPTTLSNAHFVLDAINNSTVAENDYYYTLETYNNADCSTTPLDFARVGFIFTNGSLLSLTVDGALTFTVTARGSSTTCNGATSTQASTATTIPFGSVTSAANSIVCQRVTASTNSTNGYTVFIRDTGQAANALSQTLTDWTGTNAAPTNWASPGTEGYAYTTPDPTLGTGTANRFTNSGPNWAAFDHTTGGNSSLNNKEIVYEATGVSSTTYDVGFQAGVSTTTDPGTYSTTVVYTCTPVY